MAVKQCSWLHDVLLFSIRQGTNVRVTIYGGVFVLTLGRFAVFGKYLKSDALVWLWENSALMENAANLVVRGNISLTINNALSATVIELSAVVRTQ
jgi:hypothetical protein